MPRLRKNTKKQDDYQKLEELKLAQTATETAYKEFEKVLLGRYPEEKKFATEGGTFSRSQRENWEVVDKCGVVSEMGIQCYKEHSTISKSGIIKGIGEKGFEKCGNKGYVVQKESSIFYKYTKAKE